MPDETMVPLDVAQARFEIQEEVCARCGKRIRWSRHTPGEPGAWQAHHINGDYEDHRLSNCACLCVSPRGGCHLDAHGGNYQNRIRRSRAWFPFLT